MPSALAVAQATLAKGGNGGPPNLEQVRTIVDSMVPFCNLVGVRVTELRSDGAVAELPDRENLRNHMGTVHAGALFLAAEVACAAAFSGAMGPRLLGVRGFLLRNSHVSYLKPAQGRIRARGTVDRTIIADVLTRTQEERFDLTGRALIYDDNDLLLVKVDFDYVAWVAAG